MTAVVFYGWGLRVFFPGWVGCMGDKEMRDEEEICRRNTAKYSQWVGDRIKAKE